MDRDGRIWWGQDGNNVPAIKRFLSEVKQGIVPQTIWGYDEVGHTQDAKKQYLEILNAEEVFTTPKPVALIKRVVQLSTEEGDIILDSFAGSGTTAHAVLDLNKEDGGDRKFILVQMSYDTKDNETERFNICQKITAERVHRVIQGYKYEGTRSETLLEEKVRLNVLKKADKLLERVEEAKSAGCTKFDKVKVECQDGFIRVLGIKKIKDKMDGLGGSFNYVRVGASLFGEYRELGDKLPAYEELAKYIFYTETSRDFNRNAMNAKTGRIGEHHGTSYYLLYTPDGKEGRALDLPWLHALDKTEKNQNMVIYCEKIWVHRDDLATYEMETQRSIRLMHVPFHLK